VFYARVLIKFTILLQSMADRPQSAAVCIAQTIYHPPLICLLLRSARHKIF